MKRIIVIGAGAAGLMAAITAAKAGALVTLIDHGKKAGAKILISGGGRCNFTNIGVTHERFLGSNPHFHKSALARYTHWDFLELLAQHNITWHEKTLGQLFCDQKAPRIVQMLLDELKSAGAELQLNCSVESVAQTEEGFLLQTTRGVQVCDGLIIATGGKSIPKMGATGFGYDIARQFDLDVVETRAALVPLTFTGEDLAMTSELSGVSAEATVSCRRTSFRENILFTHRGLSGPAILQISSYWREGDTIQIDLLPEGNVRELLQDAREKNPKQRVSQLLQEHLPKRLVAMMMERFLNDRILAEVSNKEIERIAMQLHCWQLKPAGTEGYRTAEVTLGGVSTNDLSSKTMEAKAVKGLYFIGECVDVTGWLGGYNFQWAWASGYVAGEAAAL